MNKRAFTFRPIVVPGNGTVQVLLSGSYFRIHSATGSLQVRGDFGTAGPLVAGDSIKEIEFGRLEITDLSGSSNTVLLVVGDAELVSATTTGSVSINGPVTERPELPGASANLSTAFAANVAQAVFAAAANTNGAIVWAAASDDYFAATTRVTLIAKNGAPATPVDGEIIAQAANIFYEAATGWLTSLRLSKPERIASGVGLYWIANGASGGGFPHLRSIRYTLL